MKFQFGFTILSGIIWLNHIILSFLQLDKSSQKKLVRSLSDRKQKKTKYVEKRSKDDIELLPTGIFIDPVKATNILI